MDEIVSRFSLDRLDLIKIDVEGFEMDVLEGARDTLERLRPNVFLEFNSFTLIAYGNHNPRSVLERLLSLFSAIYRFEDEVEHRVREGEGVHGFMHDNLIKHGCVDDLYCTFEVKI